MQESLPQMEGKNVGLRGAVSPLISLSACVTGDFCYCYDITCEWGTEFLKVSETDRSWAVIMEKKELFLVMNGHAGSAKVNVLQSTTYQHLVLHWPITVPPEWLLCSVLFLFDSDSRILDICANNLVSKYGYVHSTAMIPSLSFCARTTKLSSLSFSIWTL